jgi:nicotinate-nucleotide adenylyltransferase
LVKSPTSKVALFGGSFDPPHIGHQEIIKKALQSLDIERLIVLPAYHNPFKDKTAVDAQERLGMCQNLFGGIEGVVVDDFEIREEIVYTIESFKYFKKSYNVAYVIIGTDNLERLQQWKDFDKLNAEITWVVAKRGKKEFDMSFLNSYRLLDTNVDISSSEIRAHLELQYIDKKIVKKVEALYNKGKKKI